MRKNLRFTVLLFVLFLSSATYAQVHAWFTYSTATGGGCSRDSAITFADSSSSTGGAVTQWFWNFGDTTAGNPDSSFLQNPTHSFSHDGVFHVSLAVTDSHGNTDTTSRDVQVLLIPALVYPSLPAVCGNTAVPAGNAFVSNGVAGFGHYSGPGVDDSTGVFYPSVAGAGTHTLWYTFTSLYGCRDSVSQTITVYPQSPATFTVNSTQQCLGSNLFTFTNTTPGQPTSFLWNFGDGDSSIVKSPIHSYADTGTYHVTLVLPGSNGCPVAATDSLRVVDAFYGYSYATICNSQLPYLWNGHQLTTGGVYTDTLSSATGCDSISVLSLTVDSFSVSNFTYSFYDSTCSKRQVHFAANTTANQQVYWNLGDGTTSTDPYVFHTYQYPGTYTVLLTVTNQCGADSFFQLIRIVPDPQTILPAVPATLFANRQCAAGDSSWTNYYYDNNTIGNTSDDILLLSLRKNGNNIGDIGDGTFQLKVAATQAAGSNTGILLTNPLITNPSGFWVMNRFWNVVPTHQPTSPVGVKFYFNTQDLADVNGSYPSHNLSYEDLIFYKTTGGDPDPTSNLAGATGITSIIHGATADTAHWVYSTLAANSHIAEFAVSHFSGGGGGATGNGQVLPLTLLSFDAHQSGNTNVLTWTTAAEVNLNNFEVQRSASGTEFTTIGSQAAVANGKPANYQFSDHAPNQPATYYRLKMNDNDGRFSYSIVRKVSGGASFDAVVYPNPVTDRLWLKMRAEGNRQVQLSVVSLQGEVLQVVRTTLPAAGTGKPLNVAVLAPGTYFLRITTAGETKVIKFQKM